MIELTEKQEQEMIDRAKAGDPEANYQMSLWALEQAMAEPEEERWNRLAAKCLVKAAEAGYAPAKEKMDELLAQSAEAKSEAPGQHEAATAQPAETAAEAPAAVQPVSTAAPAPAGEKTAAQLGASIAAGFTALGGKLKGLFAKIGKPGKSDGETAGNAAGSKKSGLFNFSQWDDAKWKKMQIICVIVCVLLALLITIMLITGRKKRSAQPEAEITIPAAEVIATPVPATPTPTPAEYPAGDVKAEITAAALDVYPGDGDYVTEPTTRTVATSGSSLNVRSGPGSSYNLVTSLENGASVDVYAFKNGWALTKVGTAWGWCSNDYLK